MGRTYPLFRRPVGGTEQECKRGSNVPRVEIENRGHGAQPYFFLIPLYDDGCKHAMKPAAISAIDPAAKSLRDAQIL
jgi:hypothetical protein